MKSMETLLKLKKKKEKKKKKKKTGHGIKHIPRIWELNSYKFWKFSSKRKETFLKIVTQSKVFHLFGRFQNNQLTVILKNNFSQKGDFQWTLVLLVVLLVRVL